MSLKQRNIRCWCKWHYPAAILENPSNNPVLAAALKTTFGIAPHVT
jgi:hypothetical protein